MTQLPITFVSNVCRDVCHHDFSNSIKVEQIINSYCPTCLRRHFIILVITEARSARCKKCIVRSDKLSVLSFVFAILSDYLKVWRKILHDGSENISIIIIYKTIHNM